MKFRIFASIFVLLVVVAYVLFSGGSDSAQEQAPTELPQ
jgi:hypothetical protein